MRCAALLLFLSLASFSAVANHEETEPSDGTVNSFIVLDPPQVVEPVKLVLDNQQSLDMSAFKGKVVLLNLWATWCPPCIRELPALDRLQQRLGGDDFVVVAVALDRAGFDAVKTFYDDLKLEHLALYTSTTAEFGRVYPVDVFPASFFLDRDGRVLSYLRSYADWDDEQADEMVRRLIAQP
ncbi:TlpA disulfide reductase family protein [Motiliproteus sediminis]|uniref:TlpA disulfide reductase family protein n=1 Tax=Motiliproteus sediminis TaxID=1468178 RepID=UPI001AEF3B12|nr:TlpA disulfide reductase family protein [Motiliproteus sediminis]